MSEESDRWLNENITPAIVQRTRVEAALYRGRSAYQSIEVLELAELGRSLILDGKTQSTEEDEFVYHEALVHPALVAHHSPRRVFIAGGGEGATLREVLRHRTVRQAVMVDIDREVVEICRRLLPKHHQGSFEDPRTQLLFEDAYNYLAGVKDGFDAAFLDLTDPTEEGPSHPLFTREFLELVRDSLAPQGVMVVQAGPASAISHGSFAAINHTLADVFPRAFAYVASVPSFGGQWGFAMGSMEPDPTSLSQQEIDLRLEKRVTGELRFYDGVAHTGMFSLPKFLRQALAREKRIITGQS
ncbi:MAG: polyamine aminopropyltransferase, partial [Dehalococcoidia bacterium]|nr:polyamine aminopropyltransferase [Dehalococcoidia bacterium]